jgi:hypothetical protein
VHSFQNVADVVWLVVLSPWDPDAHHTDSRQILSTFDCCHQQSTNISCWNCEVTMHMVLQATYVTMHRKIRHFSRLCNEKLSHQFCIAQTSHHPCSMTRSSVNNTSFSRHKVSWQDNCNYVHFRDSSSHKNCRGLH